MLSRSCWLAVLDLSLKRRRLLAVGDVATELIDHVGSSWLADSLGMGSVNAGDAVLLIYDPDHADTGAFLKSVFDAAEAQAALGILPVRPGELARNRLDAMLGTDVVTASLADCRFRLTSSAHFSDPSAPAMLRRAMDLRPEDVADDLSNARILFLQGHSGPFDGSFGQSLTLCSRGVHQAGEAVVYPCAETGRCFRPSATDDRANFVDPRDIRSAIVLLDGCGTFPVPGSLYSYDQSLLRGLMLGTVHAAVLSMGISATPKALPVMFMAQLALGACLGEVVRRCNSWRARAGSPTSAAQPGALPWLLVGNPCVRVAGLSVEDVKAVRTDDGFSVPIPASECASGGSLMRIEGIDHNGRLEIVERAPWAVGGRDEEGLLYLWAATDHAGKTPGGQIMLKPAHDRADHWRTCLYWLRAGCDWLNALAAAIEAREADALAVRRAINLRTRVAEQIALAVHAATAPNSFEIARGLTDVEPTLRKLIKSCDTHVCDVVSSAAPTIGARLSHLWSPAWDFGPSKPIGRECTCGAPIMGHPRSHPVLGIVRLELSCVVCSLIGDVAAQPLISNSADIEPAVLGSLQQAALTAGGLCVWRVEAMHMPLEHGTARATLFDPYRVRIVQSDTMALGPDGASIVIDIPADWPSGLSWTTLVIAVEGRLSMMAFDVMISGIE